MATARPSLLSRYVNQWNPAERIKTSVTKRDFLWTGLVLRGKILMLHPFPDTGRPLCKSPARKRFAGFFLERLVDSVSSFSKERHDLFCKHSLTPQVGVA
jgi:hypothetical protein